MTPETQNRRNQQITPRHVARLLQLLGLSETALIAAVLEIDEWPIKVPSPVAAQDTKSIVDQPHDDSRERRTHKLVTKLDNCSLIFRGVPVREMFAYPTGLAAKLIGVSDPTLRREIARGRIRRTEYKLIPRSELLRYLEASLPPLQPHSNGERRAR
jgi:hypothetical protein